MTDAKGMQLVPGGVARMGSLAFYPEERPLRTAPVTLRVDAQPVINAAFRRFVAATGHRAGAERRPDPDDFPGAALADLVPGSQVFTPTAQPVPLDDWTRWWCWVPDADRRHPESPGSTLDGRRHHPVVHVGYEDALAFADRAGKRLPTESEWEHAARGGLERATYAWGEDFTPRGRIMANTWHGRFPFENLSPHGFSRTSPVDRFPPNGYGLRDTTGNVWEWTASAWGTGAEDGPERAATPCCGSSPALRESDRRVIKGGSHLCAPNYCHRYRPAARQGHAVRSTTGHVGFRCVRDVVDADRAQRGSR